MENQQQPVHEFMAPCVGDSCIGCGWACQILENFKRPKWADRFPQLENEP